MMAGMADSMPRSCDLAIRGGTVIDGTGEPGRCADVAITGDRIVAMGDLAGMAAEREIDAHGLAVAPGFIDTHTHDDHALIALSHMTPKVSQGVTTVVAGNCGVSLAPALIDRPAPQPFDLLGDHGGFRYGAFGDYVAALEDDPPALNAVLLVGHITLRYGAGIDDNRPASDAEIAAMETRMGEAMAAGAAGFSNGLDYDCCSRASTDEVVALAAVAARAGGVYTSHIRDYFDHVDEAIEEAFEIARRAAAPLVISHHQATGADNFGHAPRTLGMIERARARQPVAIDAYPYNASSKVLDPARARPGVRILITWSTPHPGCAGRALDDIAAGWDVGAREAAERLLPAGAVYFQLDEDDVRRVLAWPHTMIGSDGLPHDVHPHPRLWGAFPRVLGHYVRDVGLFALEEAVRRMTSLPASVFGLADRGMLREGAFADVVVFDPRTISDRGTYDEPAVPSAGIDLVMVNGGIVWQGGGHGGARPGRVLRRSVQA